MTTYLNGEFIPAEFPLYEFDPLIAGDGASRRRWLQHWNGQIGTPATEVILGWSQGTDTVFVSTSTMPYDIPYARFLALHIAIGNDNLPAVSRHYRSAQERTREIELHSQADDEWGPPADGDPDAVVTTYRSDFIAGYKFVPAGCIYFVAAGRMPFSVRILENAQPYDLDPTRRFPLRDWTDRLAAGRP